MEGLLYFLTKKSDGLAGCIEVVGDDSTALRWLETSNFTLGNQRPLELLENEEGIQPVLDTLGRIEHGVPV